MNVILSQYLMRAILTMTALVLVVLLALAGCASFFISDELRADS